MHRASSTGFLVGLLLVGTACSSEQPSEPTGTPSAIEVVAGDAQQAVVGTAVVLAPRVRVVTTTGTPRSNAAVTFTVISGGGTLTSATATTDARGEATAGRWTLGTVSGPQTLVARTGASSVTITAIAQPGPASAIAALASNATSARIGDELGGNVLFRITDQYGNAVGGAAVYITVIAGEDSSVAPYVYTDAAGLAGAAGVRLAATGPSTLVATVGDGITARTSILGAAPTGCRSVPYRLGARVDGTIATDDCSYPGFAERYDRYALDLTRQQTAFSLRLSGAGSRGTLRITGDSLLQLTPWPAGSNALEFRYVLPAGRYLIEPSSSSDRSYTLHTAATTGGATPCGVQVVVLPGVSFTDSLTSASCVDPSFPARRVTRYRLHAPTAGPIRVTLRSVTFTPALELRVDAVDGANNPVDALLASSRASSPTSATTVNYTSAYRDMNIVVMSTDERTGPFTLTVSRP